MRPAGPLDAYRPAIAPIEDFLYGQNGRQPGDPAKAAEAMIATVEDPNPPRRLVLGADAYDALDRIMAARMADIARHRALGQALVSAHLAVGFVEIVSSSVGRHARPPSSICAPNTSAKSDARSGGRDNRVRRNRRCWPQLHFDFESAHPLRKKVV